MTLYRQYRPLKFNDLIGQDISSRILQQALLKERLAHAYLFSGPRGTGKTSTARIFAKAACCLNPVKTEGSFEPCGVCESCQLIAQNQATDVIEIDAASNRGIEDIRLLREQAQYPPAQLKYRIYIIDECHMLTGDAFNALLKTLEEPPPHCLFILATTELHKVPLTVRSRCQLIRFERGSVASITKKLDHIVKDNKWQVEAKATALIAASADGGFRDAETLLEQLITQHDTLTEKEVLETLGTISSQTCSELLQACLEKDGEKVSQLLSTHFNDQSLRFGWILSELIHLLRDQKNHEPLHTFALQQFLEAAILQKNTPVQSLPLEIACFSIVEKDAVLPQRIVTQPTVAKPILHETPLIKPEENTSMDKVKVTIQTPEPPQNVPVVEIRQAENSDIRRAWKEAINDLVPLNFPLAQMLKGTIFHMADADTITVHVRYKFHVEKLSEHKNRGLIEKQLKVHTGTQWKLVFILNASMPKHEPKKQLAEGLDQTVKNVFTAPTA